MAKQRVRVILELSPDEGMEVGAYRPERWPVTILSSVQITEGHTIEAIVGQIADEARESALRLLIATREREHEIATATLVAPDGRPI